MMQVNLADAYDEACRALGESIVRERLLTRELERVSSEAASGSSAPETSTQRDDRPEV